MKYQIVGKNIEVTAAISNKIETKLSRLDKFFVINDAVTCRALVRSYKVGAKVEITIFTSMMDLRAEVKHDDLYAAVDLALDKLENQLRKLKTRIKDYKHPSLCE
jgi:putative sigma-54 modulation protein